MVYSGSYYTFYFDSITWLFVEVREEYNESMYNEMPIYDHNYDNHDYTCRDPAAG